MSNETPVEKSIRLGQGWALEFLAKLDANLTDQSILACIATGLCTGAALFLERKHGAAYAAETLYRMADIVAVRVPPGKAVFKIQKGKSNV